MQSAGGNDVVDHYFVELGTNNSLRKSVASEIKSRAIGRQLSAHRRHWGQGISPASCVNVHLRDACALTAPGGEGLGPAGGGAFSKR